MLLGERLKKAREDAGWTLKKFADVSKIQVRYLEYLEEGRYEKLPAFVYIQGFLKKYAEILNLPMEELIHQCQSEIETGAAARQDKFRPLPKLPTPRIIITPKKITWAIVALALVLVTGYLVYQLDFLIAPPNLSVNYPASDITIERGSIEVIGESDPSSQVLINGQQVFIEKDGYFRQEINLSPGVNTLKIQAVNRFGKQSEIIRQVVVK